MKALILDGGADGDAFSRAASRGAAAALAARGAAVETVGLRDREIAPCAGCFGCWDRTPGECVTSDDARDIVRAYVGAGVVVYVTPVTFGGYSSALKKMVDRLIPVLDPRFVLVAGEVHHRLRYRRYPRMVVVGTLPSPDPEAERLFATVAARNALNVHQAPAATVIAGVTDPDAARHFVDRLLDGAGVPR